jgi:hypothetical protein
MFCNVYAFLNLSASKDENLPEERFLKLSFASFTMRYKICPIFSLTVNCRYAAQQQQSSYSLTSWPSPSTLSPLPLLGA